MGLFHHRPPSQIGPTRHLRLYLQVGIDAGRIKCRRGKNGVNQVEQCHAYGVGYVVPVWAGEHQRAPHKNGATTARSS
jgi:hypothetical protein